MKGVSKILKTVVMAVVVLVVFLCVVFYLFGGHLVKVGVETAATKALNVGVDVGDVDISVLRGMVQIEELVVKNPPGYAHETLLELGYGKVTADIGSLLSDTVRIKELKLSGVNLAIEQKGLSNNLQDVIKSLPAGGEQEPEAEPAGKKLRIDELEISIVQVKVKLLPVPGKADTVTLNLAHLKMSDLGTDDKLSIGALASKIMVAIAEGVAKEGMGVLPEEMVSTMKTTLNKTIGLGKSAAEEGGKLIKEGKDAGKGLIEGFKGLLGPKEK